MTAKILAFPSGKTIPALTKEQREPITKKIAEAQTIKYANAVADGIVIQMLGTLQHEGMDIGKHTDKEGAKTFLDVGIFMEAFKGLLFRELDLQHPFHYITDNLMYVERDKNKKYSVINYSTKKIVDKEEANVKFEGEDIKNDTDRLQPDSDK
jgi:hypothetical protein